MGPKDSYFGTTDFVIFAGTLLVSTIVGIFFACKDRNIQSTENYYFGERKLSPLPIAASLSVSFVSAIAVIGLPVEVYLFGSVFAWNIMAQLISTVIAVCFYIPVFHRLQLKSVYQYLELRFDRTVRIAASAIAMINLILYMGIVNYMPALALSAVTPLKLEWTIAITSAICVFYTTIGGMKAVIWTDVLQAFIMIAGMLGVFIQAVIIVGGLERIAEASERGERNNFLKFDIDPRIRSTAWTVGIGLGLNACFETGCNQVYIQRYLSCKTIKTARIALLLTLIPGFVFTLLSTGNGLALYAYYEGCDPILSGQIAKADQAMPRLAVQIFKEAPGMAGLYVSAAYCGTLSSISSGINAMSALALEDFLIPQIPALSATKQVILSKALCVLFGGLVLALAYVISATSTNIIQVATSIAGFVGGPMIGIFTMGLFMPWINSKGAMVGLVCGWATTGWIGISAMQVDGLFPQTTERLPLSKEYCDASFHVNTTTESSVMHQQTVAATTFSLLSEDISQENYDINNTLYSISPFLYGVFGLLICVVSGNISSFLTGCNKRFQVDKRLFVPIVNKLLSNSDIRGEPEQMISHETQSFMQKV